MPETGPIATIRDMQKRPAKPIRTLDSKQLAYVQGGWLFKLTPDKSEANEDKI